MCVAYLATCGFRFSITVWCLLEVKFYDRIVLFVRSLLVVVGCEWRMVVGEVCVMIMCLMKVSFRNDLDRVRFCNDGWRGLFAVQ